MSYKPGTPSRNLVIQQHDAAADVTAGRSFGSHQRTNAGVCTQIRVVSQSRSQLLALRQQQIHLFRCNPHIIHLIKTTRLEVVPIKQIVSPGTRISALAGLRQRFKVHSIIDSMPKINNEPFAGNMSTLCLLLQQCHVPKCHPRL